MAESSYIRTPPGAAVAYDVTRLIAAVLLIVAVFEQLPQSLIASLFAYVLVGIIVRHTVWTQR